MEQLAPAAEPYRFGTVADYLALDHAPEGKYEYFGDPSHPGRGEIVAMAGSTSFHALITVNVSGELRQRMKGTPCRAYSPDKRIVIPRHPTYTYPDVSVICGPEQPDPRNPESVASANPRLLVEVLSPSTESNDRSRKFKRYLQVPSLQEYVLVSQDEPRVEVYFRQPGGSWLFSFYVGLAAVAPLRSVDVDLPLAEVYLNVTFPPTEDGDEPAGDDGGVVGSGPGGS